MVDSGGTIALAVLAIGTVVIAVFEYKSQNRQLRALETQAAEQHAVNIRQIEVLDAQLTKLREAPKLRAIEAEEQAQAEARQAVERRRAQAGKVFLVEERHDRNPAVNQVQNVLGQGGGPVIVSTVSNSSDKPVYDLVLSWHKGSAPWDDFERRTSLLPGTKWSSTKALPSGLPGYVDQAVFGAVVRFRDDAGSNWRRRPDGVLDEIAPGQPLP